MSQTLPSILIVEDDDSLRQVLSMIFEAGGYGVRSAPDGIEALAELRRDVPSVLLTDLEMPRMSGFELLSVVRRRFPMIPLIAMSGAYSGCRPPPGVAAHAYYEKGNMSVDPLIEMVNALATRSLPRPEECGYPIWISGESMYQSNIFVSCPECLRPFSHALAKGSRGINEASCPHCKARFDCSLYPFAADELVDRITALL
jgi:CheY-like chemotaxis protein